MIVCVCNGLNDKSVQSIIVDTSPSSSCDVYKSAGCAPRCGKCRDEIEDMIVRHKESQILAIAAD